MAKTTWGPAPWIDKETWLLTDNSVVQSPDVETTASHGRIRVAGTTKSFGKNQLISLQRDAVAEIAAARSAQPWVRLQPEQDQRNNHGGTSPGSDRCPDYTKQAQIGWSDPSKTDEHVQVTFEFESEECPSITATMWVVFEKSGYRHDSNYKLTTALTYRLMHPAHGGDNNFMRYDGGEWFSPFNYYDNSTEVTEAKEFLNNFKPIPDFEFVNDSYINGARAVVVQAINVIQKIKDIEYVEIPVWRTKDTPTPMKFKFKRSNFTTAFYQDLVDFIQTKPTMDRIKENYAQIQRDLTSLGIVAADKNRNHFLEIVEGAFAEEVVCHMIPLTEDGEPQTQEGGSPKVVEDHGHTVSVDLLSGTIVVSCSVQDTDVLEHWNFERMKAELKGELDAFLGYCRQKQQKRVRRTFNRIVKHRTPEPVVIDGVTNA